MPNLRLQLDASVTRFFTERALNFVGSPCCLPWLLPYTSYVVFGLLPHLPWASALNSEVGVLTWLCDRGEIDKRFHKIPQWSMFGNGELILRGGRLLWAENYAEVIHDGSHLEHRTDVGSLPRVPSQLRLHSTTSPCPYRRASLPLGNLQGKFIT